MQNSGYGIQPFVFSKDRYTLVMSGLSQEENTRN